MVFIFILDVISSLTLSLAVKCSSWVLYKSANGLCYIYEKLKPNQSIEMAENINENELIVLTREEYDKLIGSSISSNKNIKLNTENKETIKDKID